MQPGVEEGYVIKIAAIMGSWSSIPLDSSVSQYSVKHLSELTQQKGKEAGVGECFQGHFWLALPRVLP